MLSFNNVNYENMNELIKNNLSLIKDSKNVESNQLFADFLEKCFANNGTVTTETLLNHNFITSIQNDDTVNHNYLNFNKNGSNYNINNKVSIDMLIEWLEEWILVDITKNEQFLNIVSTSKEKIKLLELFTSNMELITNLDIKAIKEIIQSLLKQRKNK